MPTFTIKAGATLRALAATGYVLVFETPRQVVRFAVGSGGGVFWLQLRPPSESVPESPSAPTGDEVEWVRVEDGDVLELGSLEDHRLPTAEELSETNPNRARWSRAEDRSEVRPSPEKIGVVLVWAESAGTLKLMGNRGL